MALLPHPKAAASTGRFETGLSSHRPFCDSPTFLPVGLPPADESWGSSALEGRWGDLPKFLIESPAGGHSATSFNSDSSRTSLSDASCFEPTSITLHWSDDELEYSDSSRASSRSPSVCSADDATSRVEPYVPRCFEERIMCEEKAHFEGFTLKTLRILDGDDKCFAGEEDELATTHVGSKLSEQTGVSDWGLEPWEPVVAHSRSEPARRRMNVAVLEVPKAEDTAPELIVARYKTEPAHKNTSQVKEPKLQRLRGGHMGLPFDSCWNPTSVLDADLEIDLENDGPILPSAAAASQRLPSKCLLQQERRLLIEVDIEDNFDAPEDSGSEAAPAAPAVPSTASGFRTQLQPPRRLAHLAEQQPPRQPGIEGSQQQLPHHQQQQHQQQQQQHQHLQRQQQEQRQQQPQEQHEASQSESSSRSSSSRRNMGRSFMSL